ncbi:hypothetical protein QR680_002925 [Steinernema hermaphroditum]|uniref:Uncharacterized protein n=1 Tax=Steinernema hermaphroditum TaxID=289476 RepID=A0AA39H6T5_9BILA|nr:hypothetical protein QR680_002925 [Steinernema hermaphroditum]
MSAPSTPSKSSNGADGFISNAFTTDAPTSTGRSFDFGWRLKAKLPKVLQNPMASISSVVDVVDSALFSVVESNVLEGLSGCYYIAKRDVQMINEAWTSRKNCLTSSQLEEKDERESKNIFCTFSFSQLNTDNDVERVLAVHSP